MSTKDMPSTELNAFTENCWVLLFFPKPVLNEVFSRERVLISESNPHALAGYPVPDLPPDETLDETFDGIACRWEQEEQSRDVGQQSRGDQDETRDEDQKAVKELLARDRTRGQIPLDAMEDAESFEPCEVRPQDARSKDQQQCVDCAESPPDFDEQSEFQNRDDDEHRQENAEYFHGFMIAWAV
jgi:hypothetical protein